MKAIKTKNTLRELNFTTNKMYSKFFTIWKLVKDQLDNTWTHYAVANYVQFS